MSKHPSLLSLFFVLLLLCVSLHVKGALGSENVSSPCVGPSLVEREYRRSLVVTEYGEISAVEISAGNKGPYHLQFITLEPNSLFLPVLLHADTVFYVRTGSGRLSWTDDGREIRRVNLRKGDIYRLQSGSVFYMQSNVEAEREKLRIQAMFSSADEGIYV